MTGYRWERLKKSGAAVTFLIILIGLVSTGTAVRAQLSLQLKGEAVEAQPPQEEIELSEIARFDRSQGGYGIIRGSFDGPVDVSGNKLGAVYVLDSGNRRVQVFDQRLKFRSQFGSRGHNEGEFHDPMAVAVDDAGFVYVVDTGNHRIQKFDPEGEFILEWGSLGTSPGLFKRPLDLTFDDENNVYVADTGNERVQIFTSGGRLLDEWTRYSVRTDKEISFRNMVSLAYDDDRFGFILTLNDKDRLVQRFELDGDVWEIIPVEEPEDCLPVRMEVDNHKDHVYLADPSGNRILKYNKRMELGGGLSEGDTPFLEPSGLWVDRNNHRLYVADTGNNKIQKFYLR